MTVMLDAFDQAGLHSLGHSYGTALGASFAMMLSERVERVFMDDVLYNFMHYVDRYQRACWLL